MEVIAADEKRSDVEYEVRMWNVLFLFFFFL
jgi:hypothetical protein